MKFPHGRQALAAILVAPLLSAGLFVLAQERPKQPTVQEREVSDAELQAFAKAYVQYHKIRAQYEPQVKATKDPQKSKKIQDEANAKVKEVLAKQQLTVQNYNRVFTVVNNDESLRKRAMKLIEEERKKR